MATLEADALFLSTTFTLEIEGLEVAHVKSVSGLGSSIPVHAVNHAKENGRQGTHKVPGATVEYNDIVVVREASADKSWIEWYEETLNGSFNRKNGSVIVYDLADQEVARWNFESAWITSWQTSELSANNDSILLETITLTIDRLERTS